jgi:hypothetical protein
LIHLGVASFNERQWATGHEDPASFALWLVLRLKEIGQLRQEPAKKP